MLPSIKKTLVLGASANPQRYSYLAVNKLREHHHPVLAIGSRLAKVADVNIETEKIQVTDLDTVTVYLNKDNQKNYYDYILAQHPRRVIFNPGAENSEFERRLNNQGIQTVEACTLVLLGTGQY
jgi:uncharacterized protein